MRIATNQRIFVNPSTPTQVREFAGAVMGAPGYRDFAEPAGLAARFLDLCIASNATANLAQDALIAAVAASFACPVLTFDTDFYRFTGLAVTLLQSSA
jgi:predicted nucleic acid-binding protein